MGGYAIGISFGLLIMIAIIVYGSLICKRLCGDPSSDRSSINPTTEDDSITIRQGLDEDTLLTYPELLYSDAKLQEGSIASGCSICLADYKDTDMLRLLPNCNHFFHQKCIDPWLRIHRTCPICRMSPM
ncbi:unnamed protein product [Ilex paraguariensis]|uniref:RING-type E3 ubiquitin transferase n=1 Tax=Ilex paraguariensis TaxID=185542 RepID=A0ABC8RCR3_9AQUA